MARFGVRRVLLIALLLIAVGVGLTPAMRQPWQLDLLWGVVVGAGTGSMAGVLAATVANRWFIARRGLVIGILTAAGATGALVFLPVLASLAVGPGWRWASLALAPAALAAVPVVAVLMRGDPAPICLRPYGAPAGYQPPTRAGNPFSAAIGGLTAGLRSGDFWL